MYATRGSESSHLGIAILDNVDGRGGRMSAWLHRTHAMCMGAAVTCHSAPVLVWWAHAAEHAETLGVSYWMCTAADFL